MFKKFIYFSCASAMLLTTACSSDDVAPVAGQDALVSFTVQLPADIQSRAYSDGLTARKLTVAVYDASDAELAGLTKDYTFAAGELTKTINLRLANSRSYKVAFWVQKDGAPYTFTTANHKVDVNYSAITANSDDYDAFFNCVDVTVNGSITKTVELRRPFAQINIGATDYTAAAAAGWVTDKTSVHVDNVYSTLDLFDGTVSGLVAGGYTYTLAPKPVVANDGAFPAAGVDAEYQSMVYVLTGADQSLTNVEFKAEPTTNPANVLTRNYANVPIRRNYQTNIYGNILTEEANFTVEIKPAFDGKYSVQLADGIMTDNNGNYGLYNANGLDYLAELNNSGVDAASGEISLLSSLEGNAKVVCYTGNNRALIKVNGGVLDGNGYTLHPLTGDYCVVTSGGTIKNINIQGGFRGIFAYDVTSDIYLENVNIYDAVYTFNAGDNFVHNLYAKNCRFNGWTSFSCDGLGADQTKAVFTNCAFGRSIFGDAYLKPYKTTELINCTFDEGYQGVDATHLAAGQTVTFKNCYVGSTLITAANIVSLFDDEDSYVAGKVFFENN